MLSAGEPDELPQVSRRREMLQKQNSQPMSSIHLRGYSLAPSPSDRTEKNLAGACNSIKRMYRLTATSAFAISGGVA
jgi:hypothetical protein